MVDMSNDTREFGVLVAPASAPSAVPQSPYDEEVARYRSRVQGRIDANGNFNFVVIEPPKRPDAAELSTEGVGATCCRRDKR